MDKLIKEIHALDEVFTHTFTYTGELLYDNNFVYSDYVKNISLYTYLKNQLGFNAFDLYIANIVIEILEYTYTGRTIDFDTFCELKEVSQYNDKHKLYEIICDKLSKLNKEYREEVAFDIVRDIKREFIVGDLEGMWRGIKK